MLTLNHNESATVLAEGGVGLDLFVKEPAHHDLELFEGDHTVTIDVDLLDDLIEDGLAAELLAYSENLLDFLG